MTNKELKLKLKNLRAVKPAVLPNELWVAATRNMIVERAKEDVVPVQTQLIAPVVLPRTLMGSFMFALRPVMATIMIAAFGIVGWAAGVSSSLGNKPGNLLYGLRGAAEKTQLTFAADPASRAYLHLELAGRRANELAVLAEGSGADRENDMLAAMSELQNEISNVKQNLTEINGSQSADTAAVAKAVDRKVAEINAVFGKTKGLMTPKAKTKADVVAAAADDVSIQAVAVLIQSVKTAEDKTDAATRVAEKINTAERDMQVASTEASEQAKAALKQAKAALANDNLAEAVIKVQESANITNAVESVGKEGTPTNTNTGKIKAIDF